MNKNNQEGENLPQSSEQQKSGPEISISEDKSKLQSRAFDFDVRTPCKEQDLNCVPRPEFKSPKSSQKINHKKMLPPSDKKRQWSRESLFNNEGKNNRDGAIPVLSVHQSVMSFGDHFWPSPAHTNLGSHIQTLQAEQDKVDEERRKIMFTSPVKPQNQTQDQRWQFTPKSIEKQQNEVVKPIALAHNTTQFKHGGSSEMNEINLQRLSPNRSLIDNGSVPAKNFADSDEKHGQNYYFPTEYNHHGGLSHHDQPAVFEYAQHPHHSADTRLLNEVITSNPKLAYHARQSQSLVHQYPAPHHFHPHPGYYPQPDLVRCHPGHHTHQYHASPHQMYMKHSSAQQHQHYPSQHAHPSYQHQNSSSMHGYHPQQVVHYPPPGYPYHFAPHYGPYCKRSTHMCVRHNLPHEKSPHQVHQQVTQQLTKTHTMHGPNQTMTMSRSITHTSSTIPLSNAIKEEKAYTMQSNQQKLYCAKKSNDQSPASPSDSQSDCISKRLDMQLSETKTMLPHDIYREQTQSESKNRRQKKATDSHRKPQTINKVQESIEQTALKPANTPSSKPQQTLMTSQRRGYYLNTETGRLERIIRKRKRKSGDQLTNLNLQFDENPHWSKETLQLISRKTGLSEGQVYKWGWDQKRKKFGIEEAERMRQIEHQMDQANAARRQQNQIQGGSQSSKKVDISQSTFNMLNDREEQEFSSRSESDSEDDSDSGSSQEQLRYQTPIQPSAPNRLDSEKQQQLLSTQPETLIKLAPNHLRNSGSIENLRKRDQKSKQKFGVDDSPGVAPFTGKDLSNFNAARVLNATQIQRESLAFKKKIANIRVEESKPTRSLRSRQL